MSSYSESIHHLGIIPALVAAQFHWKPWAATYSVESQAQICGMFFLLKRKGPMSCYAVVQWSGALPQMSWVARVVDVVRPAHFQLRCNNQKSELHLRTPLEVRIRRNQNTFLFRNIFLNLRHVCFSENGRMKELDNLKTWEVKKGN